jgi:hypothetical protein
MTHYRLPEESVQHRAVVTVVVKAVDELHVASVSDVCVPQTIPWCRSVTRIPSFLLFGCSATTVNRLPHMPRDRGSVTDTKRRSAAHQSDP